MSSANPVTSEDGQRRERTRSRHPAGGRELTKQSDAMASDVNAMMERWIAHGVDPEMAGNPQYGDFTGLSDYHQALNAVQAAEGQFMDLPAHIRAHVGHDPGAFLQMVYDPERRGELEKLGLVEAQAPVAAPPAAPEPAPEPAVPPEG